jgi:hypothetical protein
MRFRSKLAGLALAATACSSPRATPRADTVVAAEPAAPDTGAVAPEVDSVLALSRVLTDSALATLPKVRCLTDTEATTHDLRRTVRGPLRGRTGFVIYVRASGSDSAVHHAEVVRHPAVGQQIGVQWDATTDSTRIVYFADSGRVGKNVEAWGGGVLPKMREMAHRALALRCLD